MQNSRNLNNYVEKNAKTFFQHNYSNLCWFEIPYYSLNKIIKRIIYINILYKVLSKHFYLNKSWKLFKILHFQESNILNKL